MMAQCMRVLSWLLLLTLLVFVLFDNIGLAQMENRTGARLHASESVSSIVPSPREQTIVGKVDAYTLSRDEAEQQGIRLTTSVRCHKQDVIMRYVDSSKKPYISFTGTKKWCYNGRKVTWGTMDVTEAWIAPAYRRGPGKDGYVYVPSGLKKTDRFLPYKGHPQGAHESTRTGRFEYRFSGVPGPAQVIMPFVSRTGRYDGTCGGPPSTDVSPKVTRTKPTSGARNVPTTSNVEATFSERMDPSTFKAGIFVLKREGASDPIKAAYRYDAATKTATLDPREPLTPGMYTATVWNGPYGVKTTEGDPIIWTRTWTFRVVR